MRMQRDSMVSHGVNLANHSKMRSLPCHAMWFDPIGKEKQKAKVLYTSTLMSVSVSRWEFTITYQSRGWMNASSIRTL